MRILAGLHKRLGLALLLLGVNSLVEAAGPIRVLFIGNSLTVANDMPALVEALAKANGDRMIIRTIGYPNYSLEDHWNRGDAKRAIAEGAWSFIVLQQGPSSLPESCVLLVDYAKRFAAEAKRAGAQTALYMVWPASSRYADFDGVRFSYESTAREIGGIFLPAGEAWRIAWRDDPKLALYGRDGFHPSPLGSYLAALIIYHRLSGKPIARVPGKLQPSGSAASIIVSDVEAKILRDAASKALEP